MEEETGPRRCGGNHVPTTKPKFTRAPPGIPLPPQIRSHVAVTLVHRAFAHIISQILKMSPRDIERPGSPAPKKVRIACRRCRAKRVKCDGGIPACSNCARARVPCIDVDGRNRDISIPRDFIAQCRTRIAWLEQQIKLLDPDFDLTKGPSVNLGENELTLQSSSGVSDCSNAVTMLETETQSRDKPATRKRPYDLVEDPETDQTPRAEASSVANAFGMLSLHSDSRQQHYMGSSSGLLFTKLIGVDRDTQISSPSSYSETSKYGRRSISQSLKQGYRSLYQSLARELPSPEEAEVLLAVYFQHIHIDYPVLHAPSLINAYLALYESTQMEPTGQYDSNGWMEGLEPFEYNGMADKESGKQSTPITVFTAVVHVFMVFSLAATVLTRKKNFDYSPTKFYRMALAETSKEQLYYNWRNIHGIFSSGATLIYCIWASPSLQATIPFAEVLRDLRTCSNLLSIGGQWWPSVRNGKGSFDKMVDLTIRQLSRTQTSTPQTRRSLQTQHTEISCQPDLGHSNLVPGYSSTRGIQPTEVPSSHPDGHGGLPNEGFPDPTGDHLDLDFGEPGLLFSNPIGMDATDTYSIDSAMESFLAEFVRGDWGWDPFSGTTAL
ncbi:transcriptional regulator family: Fungal Specific TF [Aspergillus niger]|nr:transcriptional regulator family: Fungal Specific TF [Aspergillus niger]